MKTLEFIKLNESGTIKSRIFHNRKKLKQLLSDFV